MLRSFIVSKIGSTIAKQFLTPSIKVIHEMGRNSIKYVICVTKKAKIPKGDCNVLSSAVTNVESLQARS